MRLRCNRSPGFRKGRVVHGMLPGVLSMLVLQPERPVDA